MSNTVQSFWSRVKTGKPEECWPWTGDLNWYGYGRICIWGERWITSRLAWFLTNGKIEKGMSVCHKCDNPPCCNPAHLFLGTTKQNSLDAVTKGRQLKGVEHGMCRLKESEVIEIRKLYPQGNTLKIISERFHISESHASRIILRKSWAHVWLSHFIVNVSTRFMANLMWMPTKHSRLPIESHLRLLVTTS